MEPDELDRADLLAADRRKTQLSAVGLWKDRSDLPDAEQYIHELREGDRLRRILEQAGS